MTSKRFVFGATLVALLVLLWAAGGAIASPPRDEPVRDEVSVAGSVASRFSYQGRVTDASGNPLDGVYSMQFQLYDAETEGAMLWDSGAQDVTVEDGLFSIKLAADRSVFNGQAVWLEVAVAGEALPRQEILPVPYALSLRPGAEIISEGYPALHAESTHPSGRGLRGYATATSGTNYGVVGASKSPDGYGGYFYNTDNGIGAYGESPKYGVYGKATGASGYTVGVKGYSQADVGRGVEGHSVLEIGVFGSSSGTGSSAIGVYGSSADDGSCGVKGYNSSFSGNAYGVYGETRSSAGYGVYSKGNFGATGSKNAIVQTEDYGWRTLSAVESPEVWFEDFGQAQLAEGQATVTVDPIFAQAVNLAETYHVFLTPLGDTPVLLFVTQKTPTAFTVQGVTLDGQPSEGAFDYRIVAKRLGYEHLRLEPAEDPNLARPSEQRGEGNE